MAVYTLFGQAVGERGVITQDASPYTLGVQFSVSQAIPLTGIWFYSGSGATALPAECVIFDADTQTQVGSTLNTSATWSGAAGSGWVKCAYSGSASLSAGIHYVAAVFYNSTGAYWYSDTNTSGFWTTGPGASGVTNGPLSAPNSASALNGQALYNAGSGLTFPASSVSGYDFGVDVEVTTPPEAPSLLMACFP